MVFFKKIRKSLTVSPQAVEDVDAEISVNIILEDETKLEEDGPQVRRSSLRDGGCRVHFAISGQLFEIPGIDEYSTSERERLWYSPDQIKKLNASHNKAVARMESGKKCGKKSTYRGLEGWSDETHEEITTRIHSCIDLVMDEQEDQWRSRKNDWDAIAISCQQITQKSIALALELAEKDAKEARKAYKEIDIEKDQDDCSVTTDTSNMSSISALSKNIVEYRKQSRSGGRRKKKKIKKKKGRRSSIGKRASSMSSVCSDPVRPRSSSSLSSGPGRPRSLSSIGSDPGRPRSSSSLANDTVRTENEQALSPPIMAS